MSEADKRKWDSKYEQLRQSPLDPPDAFVLRALDRIEELDAQRSRSTRLGSGSGDRDLRALDLAAGLGRNAFELARRGFRVEAWDVSPVGLEVVAEHARNSELDVQTRVADLLVDDPRELRQFAGAFDIVVVCSFLDRPLYARLHELVKPGGFLIVTTFTLDRPGNKPPAVFCLEPGELPGLIPTGEQAISMESGGRAGLLVRC